MTRPVELLLTLTASGSALGLALMLLRRVAGRRLPSAFWYYAWLPVLLRLVLPLPGVIPAEGPEKPDALRTEQTAVIPARRSYSETEEPLGSKSETGAEDIHLSAAPELPDRTERIPSAEPAGPRLTWVKELLTEPCFWLGLWMAGALFCIGRYALGYLRFYRAVLPTLRTVDGQTARLYAALGGVQGPKLFRSPYVGAPMLMGLVRPLIILPDEPMTPETAQNVLRHELTHYRRGDLIYKWFAAVVASLHWFNPLMGLFRREIDRTCELSCDERLLLRMDRREKQSYGETLLDLAAKQAPPRGVMVTTFATDKRDLKERLEQIMKYKIPKKGVIALTVAAMLLLTGCAAAMAPAAETAYHPEPRLSTLSASADTALQPTPAPTDASREYVRPETGSYAEGPASGEEITVTNVDDFLDAIAPNTTIRLAEGNYDLAGAAGYGAAIENGWYTWEAVNDGYELVVTGAEGLTILGGGAESTVISALPRYADVITFRNCEDLTLSGFTAGHTEAPGLCSGGVIALEGADDVRIEQCDLFGCGILAVSAHNCRSVVVADSVLRECSNGAVEAVSCWDVRVEGCDIRDCGSEFGSAMALLDVRNCWGFAVTDCTLQDSDCSQLLTAQYSREVYLLGCDIHGNSVRWCAFELTECTPVVEGCRFEFDADGTVFGGWYGGASLPVSSDGRSLSDIELSGMSLSHVDYAGPAAMSAPALDREIRDGIAYVTVTNVDELLAAIASDTVVTLAAGDYDLNTAAYYGACGGDHYYWLGGYDGPGLIITDVENLRIVGAGRSVTNLLAVPRGANVLTFENCRNVAVTGIEMGHTPAAGGCGGSVLAFTATDTALVQDCGLFGCGRVGVQGRDSANVTVLDSEIYDCSYVPAELRSCQDFDFRNCSIHDCGDGDTIEFVLESCENITLNGDPLTPYAVVDPALLASDGSSGEASGTGEVVLTFMQIMDQDRAVDAVMGSPGEQFQLRVELTPPYALFTDVLWESSDESVAYVNQDGLVSLFTPGECRITATAQGASPLSAECAVYVR